MPKLPCDGDEVCMVCRVAAPLEVGLLRCATCAMPWHSPCLSKPAALTDAAGWACPTAAARACPPHPPRHMPPLWLSGALAAGAASSPPSARLRLTPPSPSRAWRSAARSSTRTLVASSA
ncbi:hypothetical protein ZWY2020_041069 [Hordeum vulgare]|nr:hypothetical protein ZWY2020_041069 [Hordeum vulgare]